MEPNACILLGACVGQIEELSKAVAEEQKPQSIKGTPLSQSECKELHGTITSSKTTLSSVSSKANTSNSNDISFILCLTTILRNVQLLLKIITQHDTTSKNKIITFNAKRIKIFQLDFSLRQKLDQLAALYLQDKKGGSHIIADPDGKIFWDTHFGAETLFVPWEQFAIVFETNQKAPLQQDELLKHTLDFAEDNFVSVFEFSVFLKWFGPFSGSYLRFQESFRSGVLCGFVPGMEANMLLDGKPAGYYVVRFSKTQPGSLAVTFVDEATQIKHCLLHSSHPHGFTLKAPPTIYKSIMEFVSAHKSKLKYPITYQERATLNHTARSFLIPKDLAYIFPGSTNTSLFPSSPSSPGSDSSLIDADVKKMLLGKEEQNICVVCMDAVTNTVFFECSHMACCSVCAKSLHSCPVCRSKIARVITIFRP